jgi:hypothetical protein
VNFRSAAGVGRGFRTGSTRYPWSKQTANVCYIVAYSFDFHIMLCEVDRISVLDDFNCKVPNFDEQC